MRPAVSPGVFSGAARRIATDLLCQEVLYTPPLAAESASTTALCSRLGVRVFCV